MTVPEVKAPADDAGVLAAAAAMDVCWHHRW